MSDTTYSFVYDEFGNTEKIRVTGRGTTLQTNNFTNKGTSFTEEEQDQLGLCGLAPPAIRTLSSQIENAWHIFNDKVSDLEKFIFVRSLYDRNATLAHALIRSHLEELMPIIYTPTVGLACQNYSSMFRQANGLHFFPGNIDRAEEIMEIYGHHDIRVAVVTDNQGILGIGDQGAGGIAICLGKLMLYTQGAGIAPWHCLPVSLDVGTNNPALLSDPNYLGWRHPRLEGEDYIKFVQKFALAFKTVAPNALCQWEDFSKQNAFAIRDAHLHNLISFNDDIQGTGAVTLAAILSAMRIKGQKLSDQIFLVHGAGAGGVGIAEQLATALREDGLSEDEALSRVFALDSHGLLTTDRQLEPYKLKFAKDPAAFGWLKNRHQTTLTEVIREVGVTVLIGTSGQAGCFTQDVVNAMTKNGEWPIILPLSNPTANCEVTPAELMAWTDGKVLTATGSPFAPVNGIRIGQCNNVFVFPGIGLGVLTSGATEVLPSFFTAAARAVAAMVPAADLDQGILLPPVGHLREVCREVALAVGRNAFTEKIAGPCAFSSFRHENDPDRLQLLIERMQWLPDYLPLEAS
ncbi:MAG: NAD-dependent malic enzyme [Proteobacteria bacterium]|nr:NAD-dependent malic enzyme [Pseudomonadota bacterium]MBU1688997.1 NAD-dependent malic enzyme [Pseudomonadota bacterium]